VRAPFGGEFIATERETFMARSLAASQGTPESRPGLTSLAAETRQIVDRHQEVHTRAYRKLSLFALGLVIAVAIILILLSATTVQAELI
jgi:hypothetical protein